MGSFLQLGQGIFLSAVRVAMALLSFMSFEL